MTPKTTSARAIIRRHLNEAAEHISAAERTADAALAILTPPVRRIAPQVQTERTQ